MLVNLLRRAKREAEELFVNVQHRAEREAEESLITFYLELSERLTSWFYWRTIHLEQSESLRGLGQFTLST